nr:LacI family DNA-binding transcriptional regulator [uncultured Cohaesibacter sp.]
MAEVSPKKYRRITQAEVAKRAGVSTAVVSAILNPGSKTGIRVGKETADRVRQVMSELGYTPNPIAQSLARGKRNILGVFTYEPVFPSSRNNFFYPILRGIEMQVSGAGFDLLLFTSAQTTSNARQIYAGGSSRLSVADGAILLGQEPDSSELERLASEHYPFVTVGRRDIEGTQLNWVAAGYADATAEIVERAHATGHRHIAFLGSGTIREQQIDRQQGYEDALAKLGLVSKLTWCRHENPEQVEEAWVEQLLADGVTLLLAETLEHAQQIEMILAQRGRSIPEDLSVAVLGSPLEETEVIERWTRLLVPREEMGREAVRLLLSLLEGRAEGPAQTTLACPFVDGETMRPV